MDRGSVWYSCVAGALWLLHPVLCSEQNLFMDGAPRKRGRESLMQACVALTWCDAMRHPRVYVPPELLLVCVSASLAVNDCGERQTYLDLWETAPFQWLEPSMEVLGFHPLVWDHKLNNLAGAASEGIYKQGVCIYTGLLKLQCGKKRGQNETDQMRCSTSCKIRP